MSRMTEVTFHPLEMWPMVDTLCLVPNRAVSDNFYNFYTFRCWLEENIYGGRKGTSNGALYMGVLQ